MEIPDSLIKQYNKQLIKRSKISQLTGLSSSIITRILYKKGVDLWDLNDKKLVMNELKMIDKYEKKRYDRKELSERYNIPLKKLNVILHKYYIELWDKKDGKIKKNNNYSFWNDILDGHPDPAYVMMFLNYNKDWRQYDRSRCKRSK
jgi:hypothetical protein